MKHAALEITYLFDAFMQNSLLVLQFELASLDNVGLQHQEHDGVFGRAGARNPITSRIQLSLHGLDVLSALNKDVRVGL